jgi:hypothetical protein
MKLFVRRVGQAVAGAFAVGIIAAAAGPAAAVDVTAEDFTIRSAQDLLDLCTVSADDEEAVAAIHFCHGFASGAWHYYAASTGEGAKKFVCMPEPLPSRHDAVQLFVDWARRHPTNMQEPAVEALFRFLSEKWPCAAAAASQGGSAK